MSEAPKTEKFSVEMNVPPVSQSRADDMWKIMMDNNMPDAARTIARAIYEQIAAYNTFVSNLEYARVTIQIPRNAMHYKHDD